VIHRAYRSLNDPVKLLGFTAAQWLALVVTGALSIGATEVVGLSVKPAITLCSLVITTVAATAYASEPGGVRPVGLVADTARMLCRPRRYAPGIQTTPASPTLGLLVVGQQASAANARHVDRAQEVFTA
jgi:hypothetical protein